MKFCVNCGKQIKESTNFCPFCGAEQPVIGVSSESVAPIEKVNTPEKVEQVSTSQVVETPNHHIVLWIVAIAVIILGSWGFYQYKTYLPEGQTNETSILKYASPTLNSAVFYYGTYHRDEFLAQDYVVFLNKNKRTGKYVFPVKKGENGKIHYCYLIAVGNGNRKAPMAIDINNVKWYSYISKKVHTSIIGNNPYAWSDKMSIDYYSDHISNLNDAYQNDFK
ncbi:zinc-ribbon domain-containing protein [Lactiplantibacillus daoliensis]|uniref:Zinc-ribbon domain-containing protein n=1 Tax=Lactiplantibacillus daoliensis TaxID=2559916 RepID=A0ABW1UF81_9LACO|nr:zinc ribbon domain-containing protein [Lactiplantibacillus daoliensis]